MARLEIITSRVPGGPFLMPKRHIIALMIIAAIVLAGSGLVGFKFLRDQGNTSALCEQIKTKRSTAGTVEKVTTGSTTVAVLGDSYSAGYGIPSMADSWVNTVGKSRGWTMEVAAVSSSGILNPGACGDAEFTGRAAAINAVDPDVLIVQDGINDLGYPAADVEQAATDLLNEFRQVERVVVVGPNNVPGKQNLKDIDAALAKASARTGAEYVSTLGWALELQPDGHLTVQGHRQYAGLLNKAL